jgi:hypothetical protein
MARDIYAIRALLLKPGTRFGDPKRYMVSISTAHVIDQKIAWFKGIAAAVALQQ